jgi:hypothetical protein
MSNAINPEHYNRLNPQPKVREYIERELKDRLAMVL